MKRENDSEHKLYVGMNSTGSGRLSGALTRYSDRRNKGDLDLDVPYGFFVTI